MEVDALAAEGVARLEKQMAEHSAASAKTCTLKNAAIRREWSALSTPEKLNYIDAVKCLAKKPARTPSAIAAGAKSRFLAWHRYYTWAFEQALRNECGYQGYQPYYNWAMWADDPKRSPMLDGSPTSLSGDGAYIGGRNYSCLPVEAYCFIKLEPGGGGGCVTSGPFTDWKINMGASAEPSEDSRRRWDSAQPPSRRPGLQSALSSPRHQPPGGPRVERRGRVCADQEPRRHCFLPGCVSGRVCTGPDGRAQRWTFAFGGDAGSDLFNSPADPAFWGHHAMVDRVWWTWQNLDLATRQNAVAGTNVIGGRGANTTLDDVLALGSHVGVANIAIREAMSTLSGPFCYIYA